MKIGIIGAGTVGSSLGTAWAKNGHTIMYGVRDPDSDKARKAVSTSGAVLIGTLAEAAVFGEVIVLSVPWTALPETLAVLGDLGGKILVDVVNAFSPPSVENGSVGHDVAAWAQNARVVKAFNTMGAETMSNPDFNGEKATAFIAGDDAEAKKTVIQLAHDIGLDGIDAGPLANSVYLESMTKLWAFLARSGLGRDIAFKLIRR
jgi:8-hydroxy-5-deazaflavin:NADPH oxidoreductase